MATDPVAGPVLASVAAQTVMNAGRKAGEAVGILEEQHHPLKEIMAQIERHLARLEEMGEEDHQSDLTWLEVLGDLSHPVYLDKKGRKYQAIFVPSATTVTLNVLGVGLYLATLAAGWSFTPLPDKTEIWMQTPGTQANAVFYATDDIIGVAI